MKRQEKMDPEQRDAYQNLLKEIENLGEEANPARQILQLALQLDEKGEFYKFIEVFGDGDKGDGISPID
nr:MAG TPA: hypothetical protein [Caudoviricetes sp.]